MNVENIVISCSFREFKLFLKVAPVIIVIIFCDNIYQFLGWPEGVYGLPYISRLL